MVNHDPVQAPDVHACPREQEGVTGPVQPRSKVRLFIAAALGTVLIWVALAFLPALSEPGAVPTQTDSSPPAAPALPAPSVSGPVTASPARAQLPAPAGPPAAPPQRLVYPAAGIDVVVHSLEPTDEDKERQTIVPPATMDGYWLVPYGIPGEGSRNTTYIIGHSWQDRDAPFNHLSTRAAPGDRLTVATAAGGLDYRVDSVTTYLKSGLKDSTIWEVAPNRIVLISCYTDDLWGTNVVVVASPAAG